MASTTVSPPAAGGGSGTDNGPIMALKINQLSKALDIETAPITQTQPDTTANSSISEKAVQETTGPAPGPTAVTTSASVPAGQAHKRKRLRATNATKQFLPSQPRIRLGDDVLAYLRRSLLTTELDKLLPYMKYIFVQTPSHKHIMPLHHQKAHGRDILVNEQPGLHLVWYYTTIFIKPIPAYMYSQAYWSYIAEADPAVFQASLGFIRSYYYLIQFETDFTLACEQGLVPKIQSPVSATNGADQAAAPTADTARLPTYEEFCTFMASFSSGIVADKDVCRRFRYGELRLTRINKTTMLFRGKLAYFQIHPQWGSYLEHLLAPIITVFAILSVILNALQVTLAAHEVGPDNVTDNWLPFINVSLYLPVVVMILIGGLIGAMLLGVLVMGFKDLIWAKTVRHRRKHNRADDADEGSYGVIW